MHNEIGEREPRERALFDIHRATILGKALSFVKSFFILCHFFEISSPAKGFLRQSCSCYAGKKDIHFLEGTYSCRGKRGPAFGCLGLDS